MADSGGLPQLTQVTTLLIKQADRWNLNTAVHISIGSVSEVKINIAFQPGKLTEAFKYFLQGMGYSMYAFLYTYFIFFPSVPFEIVTTEVY